MAKSPLGLFAGRILKMKKKRQLLAKEETEKEMLLAIGLDRI